MAVAALLVVATACTSVERVAIPQPRVADSRWVQVTPDSRVQVDHQVWDRFLSRYLTTNPGGGTRLAYGEVKPQDRDVLTFYLSSLQAVDPATLNRDEQLAFWINLYNATTVAIVLEMYPITSIREVKPHPLAVGPWDRPVLVVDGTAVSLNDIKHRIIRPVFDDPRIHYALNCAAVGCPDLLPSAWRSAGLDAALEDAERAFINDRRGVQIDDDGALVLSKVYAWYKEDFGTTETAILARLRSKAEPNLRDQLEGRERVDRYRFNWTLNDRLPDYQPG